MCGSPESNLAMSLMNKMGKTAGSIASAREEERKKELLRRMKIEEAMQLKEERREQGEQTKGTLRADTAYSGVKVGIGTAKDLVKYEDTKTKKDLDRIDKDLENSLGMMKSTKKQGGKTVVTMANTLSGAIQNSNRLYK